MPCRREAFAAEPADEVVCLPYAVGAVQKRAVERMRNLGFTAWHGPTMGNVERGERVPRADELLGLALAFDTTVERLMRPLPEDGQVGLSPDLALPWQSVAVTICGGDLGDEPDRERADRHRAGSRGIRWDGDALTRVASRHELAGDS